jgi:hypothetical protein
LLLFLFSLRSSNIGYMAQTGFYDWWALVAMTVSGNS